MKLVCRSVEFLTWEFSILLWGTPDSVVRRIFDSTKEFGIQRGLFAYALDHLSVFKIIDKILAKDRSVCMWPSVCTYTRDLLIASLVPFSDIFAKYLFEIEWSMLLTPTYEAIWIFYRAKLPNGNRKYHLVRRPSLADQRLKNGV